MNKSKIEWTDYTWNPVTGCLNGCAYCYAAKMAKRLHGRHGYPETDPFRPVVHDDRFIEPYNINKPSKIFVSSMGDLFGDWISSKTIQSVIYVARALPEHTFQFLTKNPIRYNDFDFPENAWLGYSTTGTIWHQWHPRHNNNIKYVSIEPITHAPIYIDRIIKKLDWIIVGAETGNRKNKFIPDSQMIGEVVWTHEKFIIPLFMKDNLRPYWDYELIQQFPKEDTEGVSS